jgi:hypothetical protein
MPLIPFLALTVMCNLIILSAMAAGRPQSVWRQRLLGAAELLLAVAAFITACLVSWALGVLDIWAVLVVLLAFGAAVPLAGLLTYAEYALAGRRGSFGTDLRRSSWLTKFGWMRATNPRESPISLAELPESLAQIRKLAGNDPQIASVIDELESALQQLPKPADRCLSQDVDATK